MYLVPAVFAFTLVGGYLCMGALFVVAIAVEQRRHTARQRELETAWRYEQRANAVPPPPPQYVAVPVQGAVAAAASPGPAPRALHRNASAMNLVSSGGGLGSGLAPGPTAAASAAPQHFAFVQPFRAEPTQRDFPFYGRRLGLAYALAAAVLNVDGQAQLGLFPLGLVNVLFVTSNVLMYMLAASYVYYTTAVIYRSTRQPYPPALLRLLLATPFAYFAITMPLSLAAMPWAANRRLYAGVAQVFNALTIWTLIALASWGYFGVRSTLKRFIAQTEVASAAAAAQLAAERANASPKHATNALARAKSGMLFQTSSSPKAGGEASSPKARGGDGALSGGMSMTHLHTSLRRLLITVGVGIPFSAFIGAGSIYVVTRQLQDDPIPIQQVDPTHVPPEAAFGYIAIFMVAAVMCWFVYPPRLSATEAAAGVSASPKGAAATAAAAAAAAGRSPVHRVLSTGVDAAIGAVHSANAPADIELALSPAAGRGVRSGRGDGGGDGGDRMRTGNAKQLTTYESARGAFSAPTSMIRALPSVQDHSAGADPYAGGAAGTGSGHGSGHGSALGPAPGMVSQHKPSGEPQSRLEISTAMPGTGDVIQPLPLTPLAPAAVQAAAGNGASSAPASGAPTPKGVSARSGLGAGMGLPMVGGSGALTTAVQTPHSPESQTEALQLLHTMSGATTRAPVMGGAGALLRSTTATSPSGTTSAGNSPLPVRGTHFPAVHSFSPLSSSKPLGSF